MAAMTSIALGTALASAGIGAYGQLRSGRAARDAGESQARRDEYNAGVAELQAEDAIARGREAEGQVRSQVRRVIGAQRAGFAGQGVDIGVGSAIDVQADSAYLGELDALAVRNNAAREAWGYQVEAQDRRHAADIARRGGQAAYSASKWGAAGTLIGTGGSLLMQRYGWHDKSVGGGGRGPGGRPFSSSGSYTGPSLVMGVG